MIRNTLKHIRYSSAQYSTNTMKKNISSVDPKEMEFFKRISVNWWDTKGELKLLHNYNTVRVPFIVNSIKNRRMCDSTYINSATPLKHISVMDVGCGGGILSESLAELGANVTGVDVNEDLYNVAKSHASQNKKIENNLQYILSDVESILESHKNKYDVVINSECVEHVPVEHQENFIKHCTELVKPGGSIIITTINKTFKFWLIGIIIAENITKTMIKGTHEYRKLVTPNKLKTMLKRNNCEPQAVQGFYCNFINAQFKYDGDDKCFYGVHAIKNI